MPLGVTKRRPCYRILCFWMHKYPYFFGMDIRLSVEIINKCLTRVHSSIGSVGFIYVTFFSVLSSLLLPFFCVRHTQGDENCLSWMIARAFWLVSLSAVGKLFVAIHSCCSPDVNQRWMVKDFVHRFHDLLCSSCTQLAFVNNGLAAALSCLVEIIIVYPARRKRDTNSGRTIVSRTA